MQNIMKLKIGICKTYCKTMHFIKFCASVAVMTMSFGGIFTSAEEIIRKYDHIRRIVYSYTRRIAPELKFVIYTTMLVSAYNIGGKQFYLLWH